MKLEVMLSVMNLKKSDLNKMNIISKCTVINQCKKEDFEKYKNFNIYSYNETGSAKSRNRALEHITEDIIVICDDDVIYNKDYEKIILNEFENNEKADMIIFNVNNLYRKKRINKKNKRLHFYNCLNYASYNIAFRKRCIKNIRFNQLFGAGEKYSNGEDTLFILDFLKSNYKIYSSKENIGSIVSNESTWFKGYDEKYFFDKGALFKAISKRFSHILCLQYLLRHRDVLTNYKLTKAYKIMIKGSVDYLHSIKD